MTNWMNLIIIGVVIIVLVVFVLPMFGNSGQGSSSGSIGGGLGSLPSGDVGQGGLPTNVNIFTNPNNTSTMEQSQTKQSSSYNYLGTYLTPVGEVNFYESPFATLGISERSQYYLGSPEKINWDKPPVSPESARSIFMTGNEPEGSGKSSTHIQETVGRSSGNSSGSNTGNWFNNSGTPKTIGKPSSGGHVGNVRA